MLLDHVDNMIRYATFSLKCWNGETNTGTKCAERFYLAGLLLARILQLGVTSLTVTCLRDRGDNEPGTDHMQTPGFLASAEKCTGIKKLDHPPEQSDDDRSVQLYLE
jgi:hypothetical protein